MIENNMESVQRKRNFWPSLCTMAITCHNPTSWFHMAKHRYPAGLFSCLAHISHFPIAMSKREGLDRDRNSGTNPTPNFFHISICSYAVPLNKHVQWDIAWLSEACGVTPPKRQRAISGTRTSTALGFGSVDSFMYSSLLSLGERSKFPSVHGC
jgi:hypothetical protein